jgi:hypothetical protein
LPDDVDDITHQDKVGYQYRDGYPQGIGKEFINTFGHTSLVFSTANIGKNFVW